MNRTAAITSMSSMFEPIEPTGFKFGLDSYDRRMDQAVDNLLNLNSLKVSGLSTNRNRGPSYPPLMDSGDVRTFSDSFKAEMSRMKNCEQNTYFAYPLPLEIIFEIVSYLDKKDLCTLRYVNSFWRALADDEHVWKMICLREYGRDILSKKYSCGLSWKNLFIDIDCIQWDTENKSNFIQLNNFNKTARDICKGNEKYKWVTVLAKPGFRKGKHYVEITVDKCCPTSVNTIKIGFGCMDKPTRLTYNCPFGYFDPKGGYKTDDDNSWVYLADGRFMQAKNNFSGKVGKAWGLNDRIGMCVDLYKRRITFFCNGEKQARFSMADTTVYPAVSLISGNQVTLSRYEILSQQIKKRKKKFSLFS